MRGSLKRGPLAAGLFGAANSVIGEFCRMIVIVGAPVCRAVIIITVLDVFIL